MFLQPVSLIGYKKICNLAVGITVLDLFPADSSGGFDYSKFWERSICCGVAAGEIAANMSGELPADVFTVGLVQDIGVLFLVRTQPLEYGGAMGISRTKGVHLAKAEREALGVDHAQVGAVLCANWKLPRLLIEVIRHHHFAEFDEEISEEHKKIVQVVNLASLLVDFLFDSDSEELRERLDDRAKTFFGFGPKKSTSCWERFLVRPRRSERFFRSRLTRRLPMKLQRLRRPLRPARTVKPGIRAANFAANAEGRWFRSLLNPYGFQTRF